MIGEDPDRVHPKRLTLIVPAVKCTLDPVPEEIAAGVVGKVEDEMCKLFGGCTTYAAKGKWIDLRGRTHSEDVFIVESYATYPAFVAGQVQFKDLTNRVGRWLVQEKVAFTIDGTLYMERVEHS